MFVKEKKQKNKRVVVAMSGGVDSSVAAALLKKQGYEVAGVFMRFWSEPAGSRFNSSRPPLKLREGGERRNTCCSEGAEAAARAVAAKLDIPFYVLRLEKEFKKAVVDYFLAEEQRGRTPNPCVVCNKKIKFGLLFKKALGMGADYIATGHYARIKKDIILSSSSQKKFEVGQTSGEGSLYLLRGKAVLPSGKIPPPQRGRHDNIIYNLLKAKDAGKDQSYFLYILDQQQLGRLLFPVGDYTKDEVYQMAKKWRLPYRQEESFDLCFVAGDKESFIKRYLKLKPGKILKFQPHRSPLLKKERGNNVVLGQHQGLPLYTIGQRKNIPLQQGPWWVVGKNENKNILYVSNNEKDLYSRELFADQINWLSGEASKLPLKVWAKIRYKSEAAEAVLTSVVAGSVISGIKQSCGKQQSQNKIARSSALFIKELSSRHDTLRVIFKKPQRAITPGQSVVFYERSGKVLGGGISVINF